MSNIVRLANHILIATPALNDTEFRHAVVYVCEHKEDGAVGLIINQPSGHPLGLIFDQLEITPLLPEKRQMPLLYGGSLQPERGFVIHQNMPNDWRSSLLINKEVTVTTSNDIILAIAQNTGPDKLIIAMGYVGWDKQQLETEIIDNSWLVCPMDPSIIYDIPFEERWQYAGSLIGVNMSHLPLIYGHA